MAIGKRKTDFNPSKFTKTNKHNLITTDKDTLKSIELAFAASGTNLPVLVLGDTGVGKEVFSKYIHDESIYRHGSFMPINCGAIPRDLVESRLFGHKKGAFTGAHQNQVGIFEKAGKGTVFLDEVADLPLEAQVKLLRILEDGKYYPVGSQEQKTSEARIIAATNGNIEKLVLEGKFRKDLYYRLRGFRIHIKPLKERTEDIELLAQYFLYETNNNLKFTNHAMAALKNHSWDGNVRELKSVIEFSAVMSQFRGSSKLIKLEDVAPNLVSLDGKSQQELALPTNSQEIAHEAGFQSVIGTDSDNGLEQIETVSGENKDPIFKNEQKDEISSVRVFSPQIQKTENGPSVNSSSRDEPSASDLAVQLGLSGLTFKEIEAGLIEAAIKNSKNTSKAIKILSISRGKIRKHADQTCEHYENYKNAFDFFALSNLTLQQGKMFIAIELENYLGSKKEAAEKLNIHSTTVLKYLKKHQTPELFLNQNTNIDKANPEVNVEDTPEKNIVTSTESDIKASSTESNPNNDQIVKDHILESGKDEKTTSIFPEEDTLINSQLQSPIKQLISLELKLRDIEACIIKSAIENTKNVSRAVERIKCGRGTIEKHLNNHYEHYNTNKDIFDLITQSDLSLSELKRLIVIECVDHYGNKSKAAKALSISQPTVKFHYEKDRPVFSLPDNVSEQALISIEPGSVSAPDESKNNLPDKEIIVFKKIEPSGNSKIRFETNVTDIATTNTREGNRKIEQVLSNIKLLAESGLAIRQIKHGLVTAAKSITTKSNFKDKKVKSILNEHVEKYPYEKHKKLFKEVSSSGFDWELIRNQIVKSVYKKEPPVSKACKQLGITTGRYIYLNNQKGINPKQTDTIVDQNINDNKGDIVNNIKAEDSERSFKVIAGTRTGLSLSLIGKGIIKSYIDAGYKNEEIEERLKIGKSQILRAKDEDSDLFEHYKEDFKNVAFVDGLSLKEIKAKVVHTLCDQIDENSAVLKRHRIIDILKIQSREALEGYLKLSTKPVEKLVV